jgi:mRNA-degrading endonuclease toxin of MazEF toxin-antitoxin module
MPSYLFPGDIVFIPFPFEEDHKLLKRRPCLVLAADAYGARFLGAKITTAKLTQLWAYPLRDIDLASGKLKAKSWINLNRREWLLSENCLFKIATLKPEIWQAICDRLASIINL